MGFERGFAKQTLSQIPFQIIPNSLYFSQELHQLLDGQGRNSYRVTFTILEEQDISTARILHTCHTYQQTIGEEPKSDET